MSSRATRPRSHRRVVGISVVAVGALLTTYSGVLRWSTYARAAAPASLCSPGATLVADDTELQTAIVSSRDYSVICLTADITVSRSLVIDDTTVTLEGQSSEITLSGDDTYRIIYADFKDASSQDTLMVANLTLTAGNSTGASFFEKGAAIFVQGNAVTKDDTLLATNISVTNSTSPTVGGGIATLDLAHVGLYSSTFSGLTATIDGGAVYSLGSRQLVVKDVNVDGVSVGRDGGGIWTKNDVYTIFDNVTITNASAVRNGGAVFFRDDFTPASQVEATIIDSTFTDNTAGANGGAIHVRDTKLIAIANSEFARNSAGNYGGSINIDNDDTDTTDLSILSGLTFTDDSSGNDGGSLYAWIEGPMYLSNITATGGQTQADGGFGKIRSDDSTVATAKVSILNLTVTDTRSVQALTGDGGGLIIRDLDSVFIQSSTFSRNSATDDASAVLAQDLRAVTLKASTITDNYAGDVGGFSAIGIDDTISIQDSSLFGNTSGDDGAALNLTVNANGFIEVVNTTVAGNSQTGTSGTTEGVLSLNGGVGSNAKLNFVTVASNSGPDGGGVFTDGNIAVTATNSIIAGNTASAGSVDVFRRSSSTFSATYALFTSADSSVSTTLTGLGNLFGAPRLNGLANNGGATLTMLPQWDSPAFEAGDPNWVAPPANDQRGAGFPRDAGGRVSMGAIQGRSAQPPAPVFPPSAPREVQATPGNERAVVSWAPPASTGSFPVSTYQVEDTAGEISRLIPVTPGAPLEAVIDDLVNGESYAFRVRALNGGGWGAWSDYSNAVIPRPGASILITGSREGRFARVVGATTGLVGQALVPRVRFPGPKPYADGRARPVVDAQGDFTWQRRTNKKTYVFFTAEDGALRSDRVIIRARR